MRFMLPAVLCVCLFRAAVLCGQDTDPLQQRYSIRMEQQPLEQILRTLETQTGLSFHYEASLLQTERLFSLNMQRRRLDDALKELLWEAGLGYSREAPRQLVLHPLKAAAKIGKEYRISGTITDSAGGEKISGALIAVEGGNRMCFSNEHGYFSLLLPDGTSRLSISYPGYRTQRDTLRGGRDYVRGYRLQDLPAMDKLTIFAPEQADLRPIRSGQSDQISINRSKTQRLPFLLGEPDVFKAFMWYPGAYGGGEAMFGLHVRGGSPDQNLVLLDGVPVFNAFHLFGVFGIFNNDIVNSAVLHKGSFSAAQGGRLSSMVDVRTLEGNASRIKGSVSLGVLGSRMMLDIPLRKNSTSLLVSARRSYLDFMADVFGRLSGATDTLGNNGYYFYDANLKLTHRFSKRSRVQAMGYFGEDRLYYVDYSRYGSDSLINRERRNQQSSWGNRLGSLQWNYHSASGIQLEAVAFYTSYAYSFLQGFTMNSENLKLNTRINQTTEYRFLSGIEQSGFRAQAGLPLRPSLNLKTGFQASRLYLQPGLRIYSNQLNQAYSSTREGDQARSATELFGFYELHWQPDKKLLVQAGVHHSGFKVKEGWYLNPQPRVQVKWNPVRPLWVRFGYSTMQQFFHLLSNPSLGLPSDLWVPSTDSIRPEQARQYSAGMTLNLKRFQFSAETFHKEYRNLLEYKEGADYLTTGINWEQNITSGKGLSYGYEAMLEKVSGRTRGWISYTWCKATRSFAEINGGNPFPYRYDRRHNLAIVITHSFKSGIHASAVWTYNSGFAVTQPIQRYPSPIPGEPFREVYIYGPRNGYRTPDNHRLDINLSIEKKKKYYTRTWNIGLFNVYNRVNPFYLQLGYDEQGRRRLYSVSFLPLLPNISWRATLH
ncbi:MAG: TonB-dependent receptor [Bacteroidetes bacterium]|nr:TonB-dependent receptor [Bacteroidota bacterium]